MYNPADISRIDRQIEELQRLKANYQNLAQPQPINNIITTPATVPSQPIFEAKFTTENPSDIFIQNKTAFIDLKNGKLTIKEIDGEMKEYFIVLPKDEKDLRIEHLEMRLREMENKLNNTYNASSEVTGDVITTNNTYNNVNTPINTDDQDKKDNKFKFKKN